MLAHDDTRGSGPPLLFLHGFPHGRHLWDAQRESLGGAHRCIVPDLPGFGASAPLAEPSIDAYADACAGLLDALGIAHAAIVGLSMGGYVALALWRRHARRVRALVLADTRAAPDDDAARARRDALIALARRDGVEAVVDTQLAGALGRTTRAHAPERVAAFRAMLVASAGVEGLVGALAAMRDRPDATPLLATIDVPTLVVGGTEDVLTRPAELRALHARIPGSRLAMIDGAGHASCWERPHAFDEALRAFL